MPMRPHCDRCDSLIDGSSRNWVDDTLNDRSFIWHVSLNARNEEALICHACLIFIVDLYRAVLTTPPVVDNDIPF